MLRAATGSFNQPTRSQRLSASRLHFNWNLVSGSANTAGFYFEKRFHIFKRAVKNRQRIFTGFFLDEVESVIDDAFSGGFLSTDN